MESTDVQKDSLLETPTHFEVREEFESLVLADLLGPANGPEEEINERWVSSRYLVGWLAPKDVGRGEKAAEARVAVHEPQDNALPDDNPLNPLADDKPLGTGSDDSSSEEGIEDDPMTGSESMLPNALGFTFCVAPGVDVLRIRAEWGWYRRRKSEKHFKTKTGEPKLVWFRTPVEAETLLPLTIGEIPHWSPLEDIPEITVRTQIRDTDDGGKMVTLFLVNDQDGKDGKDDRWLFQVCLSAETLDGAADFVRRPMNFEDGILDDLERIEDQQTRMNYRHRVEFAVGHGTSVDWTVSENPLRATTVWTTPVPAYEAPRSRPTQIPGVDLRMSALAACKPAQIRPALLPLVEAYDQWIDTEAAKVAAPAQHLDGFDDALAWTESKARTAAIRIRAGIELVASDPVAYDAFVFMNRAMHDQRLHSLLSQRVRRGDEVALADIEATETPTWYPFQIAFILVNLPSLTDLGHPERCEALDPGPTAELLWFPTGGGKTEAYLGLTAYTLAMRRRQGTIEGRSGQHGVAVLMRYTLRLLTLQQFQRATTLICACELLRQSNVAKWGETPFRIGLWVGQSSTPNKFDQAETSLSDVKGGNDRYGGGSTLQQLTNCPWCGTKIEVGKHLEPDTDTHRIITYCGSLLGRCPFSKKKALNEGLPICIVDEEIYRLLPSLVIATVDKFAQMPWNGETAMLFGKVTRHCPRHGFLCPSSDHTASSHNRSGRFTSVRVEDAAPLRPPDLIIQDELHLITGPLGSLVGIYETAVDDLCHWTVNGKSVRPKVVVSTATIKRAGDQVNALFARRLEVFPPRGVDIEDNFFARQTEISPENPGLRFLGICASGRRLKVALIRVYVACLCAGQTLYEKYGKLADPYMTAVGYFSSIRELGGMRRLLDDDVRTRMQQMDKRGLSRRSFDGGYDELTSRKSAGDIPQILDWLEADFDPAKAAARDEEKKQGQKNTTRRPLDAIIATNMISVGVDVPRLGLMIVAGQPKQTAEYVQATARVGRRFPGLVITVHNWARPRDLSHFETFRHFHSTFHAHIESPSVTPFAPGARDRALAAVLVSMIRLYDPAYNSDDGAAVVTSRTPLVKSGLAALKDRVARVVSGSLATEVEQEANSLVDLWIGEALRPHRTLVYKEPKDAAIPLLKKPGDGPWEKFTCLNSLREVEGTSNLVLFDLPETMNPVLTDEGTDEESEVTP